MREVIVRAPSLRESDGLRPIELRVMRYICPCCHRGHSKEVAAVAHIARCFKNPAARSCKTCLAYQPAERAEDWSGYPGCAEGCDGGHSLADGMPVGCLDWEPRSTGNRKDGSAPIIQTPNQEGEGS